MSNATPIASGAVLPDLRTEEPEVVKDGSMDLVSLVERVEKLERKVKRMPEALNVNLLVFSGDLDKLLAAFTVATAAAASSMKATMFFTFWGTTALKETTVFGGKTLVERAFGAMLPGGWRRRALSRMDMGGLGRKLLMREMRRKGAPDLAELVTQAGNLGVEIYVCEMTMDLMGIRREELIDYPHLHYCGAAKFLSLASRANTSMFL